MKKCLNTTRGCIFILVILAVIGLAAYSFQTREAEAHVNNTSVQVTDLPECTYNEDEAFEAGGVYVDTSNASDGYVAVNDTSDEINRISFKYGMEVFEYPVYSGINYLPLEYGSGKYTISIYSHDSGEMYNVLKEETIDAEVDETTQFLLSIDFVDYQESDAIQEIASEIAQGKDAYDAQLAIAKYVNENVVYDDEEAKKTIYDYFPDGERTLTTGKGVCIDYATLFACMCRSQGYPCKVVSADIYCDGRLLGHAWNEILVDGKWVDIDCIDPELCVEKYDGVNFYYY